jgi:hypothetical protein
MSVSPKASLVLALLLITTTPAAAGEDGRAALWRLGVGARAGASVSADQLVSGVHLGVRGVGVRALDVEAYLMGGLGYRYWTQRVGVQAKLVWPMGDFGLYAIGGAAALRFEPIGSFGHWCRRVALDCARAEVGPEVGLGMRWRGIALDGTFGMRQLPTFMLVLGGTVGL